MDTTDIFGVALNLPSPWSIAKVEFKPDDNGSLELHIDLSFSRGGKFACPECDEEMSAYDTTLRTWRHLNFFQYRTYLHANLPRVKCQEHGVKTVSVPWAREGSGFTLLFEGWVVELAKHMPVATLAGMVGEHDTRLWRFIKHYVDEARSREDYSDVSAIGIDETSKKGHNYITVTVDLTERIEKNFPNGHTVIDKFHVIKHMNEALDKVRREEADSDTYKCFLLKKTKYLWLKNDVNLTEKQRDKKETLLHKHLKTARAYAMKLALQDIYDQAISRTEAETKLNELTSWLNRSKLTPMREFANLLKGHWNEILNYFDHRYTNAILEGMNSIIQTIKRRARGFRNDEYFKTMIYLVCGKLNLTYEPVF